MDIETKYKAELTRYLDCTTEQLFFFWKGRIGLYAALKAVGVGVGDEVIVQAFTCVVVPNAIIYTGATPVYVDVDRTTFNASFEEIKKKVTSRTKAIITQNTFGLSTDVERISKYCAENGMVCIEDCAHGFGGRHGGKSNGSFADFAFYSTQWNKPFSTGIGGILRVNNLEYLPEIKKIEGEAVSPSAAEKTVLKTLLNARNRLLNDVSYWALRKIYRQLSSWKVVVGSSAPEEIAAPVLPSGYLKKGCNTQYKAGLRALKNFDHLLEKRKFNARLISDFLIRVGKEHLSPDIEANHSFLVYPLQVKAKDRFLKLAEQKGLPVGDWFVSPIHPVTKNFEQWGLYPDDFPVAGDLSKTTVNIPLDREKLGKYMDMLNENIELLVDAR